MSTNSDTAYFNKSAYVALLCLIAFAIVITICIIKQFIWDPLLSRRFQVLRPVLTESVRKFSMTFYRTPSTRTSLLSSHQSFSDISGKTNDPSGKNILSATQSLPSNGIQSQFQSNTNELSHRSYGSSSKTSHGYTNFASHDLDDEITPNPTLQFSFQYNLSANNIKLSVQTLRHMNKFHNPVTSNTYVLIRFFLKQKVTDRPYETSPQRFQDCIRFGETFIILNHINPTDKLEYDIKFSIILITNGNMYEIAEAFYSMKDDDLAKTFFIDKTLPIHLKSMESELK